MDHEFLFEAGFYPALYFFINSTISENSISGSATCGLWPDLSNITNYQETNGRKAQEKKTLSVLNGLLMFVCFTESNDY